MFPSFSTIWKDASDSLRGVWLKIGLKEILATILSAENQFIAIIYELISLFTVNLKSVRAGTGFQWLYTLIVIIMVVLVWIKIAVGSGIRIGMNKFYIELAKNPNREPDYGLFTNVKDFHNLMFANIRKEIGIYLLSFLLIIPGIIATYKWAMVPFVSAEDPKMSPSDVLTESSQLMDGYKLKFFILSLTYIPLLVFGVFTFGIGLIWIVPFINACNAQFYLALKKEQKTIVESNRMSSLDQNKFNYKDFLNEYEKGNNKNNYI